MPLSPPPCRMGIISQSLLLLQCLEAHIFLRFSKICSFAWKQIEWKQKTHPNKSCPNILCNVNRTGPWTSYSEDLSSFLSHWGLIHFHRFYSRNNYLSTAPPNVNDLHALTWKFSHLFMLLWPVLLTGVWLYLWQTQVSVRRKDALFGPGPKDHPSEAIGHDHSRAQGYKQSSVPCL